MLQPLDGPALYASTSVTDTPEEVRVGVSALEERKVVTIQPIDGPVWFGYNNTVDSTTGTKIFAGQFLHLEASYRLPVWIVADTGETVDVRITEVA